MKKKYEKWQKAGNARHFEKPYLRTYHAIHRSAKPRGIEVTLTYEQFLKFVGSDCSYCGDKLQWTKHGGDSVRVNLDRKNNDLGYTNRNVTPCCWRCNRAKSSGFSHKEFMIMTSPLRNKK